MKIDTARIVPAAAYIEINGEGYDGCHFDVPAGEHPHFACGKHPQYGAVHAIVWFGTHGHYEHAAGPRVTFDDIAVIEKHLPAWRQRKAEVLREHHRALARNIGHANRHLADLHAAKPHLHAHAAELFKAIEEVPTSGAADGMRAAHARLVRHRGYVDREIGYHENRRHELAAAMPEADERAGQAEHEAGIAS